LEARASFSPARINARANLWKLVGSGPAEGRIATGVTGAPGTRLLVRGKACRSNNKFRDGKGAAKFVIRRRLAAGANFAISNLRRLFLEKRSNLVHCGLLELSNLSDTLLARRTEYL